jgi:hypothetical protein
VFMALNDAAFPATGVLDAIAAAAGALDRVHGCGHDQRLAAR